uniref:BOS complex subunit TMEM147 n=1 Tax=Molossus molossus TaxID=27622 RepID=A0A7J8HIE0_MOLMO|nr:hypothetical protein HJG59_011041 [Molossus molossus]
MTLFHFGNCFALTYFPYFITYNLSGLPQYKAFWKCVLAEVTYLFMYLCKMLFLATFIPTWEGNIYNFIGVHYIISSAQVWMITHKDLYLTFQLAGLLNDVPQHLQGLCHGGFHPLSGLSSGDRAAGP